MSEQRNRRHPNFLAPLIIRPNRGERGADIVTWILGPAPARPTRIVRFPKNRVLGELFAEPYPASGRSLSQMNGLGRARGEVIVPAGPRLTLYVEEEISESGLKGLGKLAPHDLQSLRLGGCGLTDSSLAHLRHLTWLEHLDLSCNHISGEGLAHLAGMLLLERLELGGQDGLTEAGLAHLPRLPSLRELDLSLNLTLQDAAIAHFAELPALEILDLHSTPISDMALADLKKLRKLRYLNISYTRISRAGAAGLCTALPLCKIRWAPTSAWQDHGGTRPHP